jgi:hypothetical protein
MSYDPRFERMQADEAAREARLIGGYAADEKIDPADVPVMEGGGGESEGFELAQQELIEHASHADQQSAHAILHKQGRPEELRAPDGDTGGDREYSSELGSDER